MEYKANKQSEILVEVLIYAEAFSFCFQFAFGDMFEEISKLMAFDFTLVTFIALHTNSYKKL